MCFLIFIPPSSLPVSGDIGPWPTRHVADYILTTNRDKIPAGFIITGPNIASQDLLFEQLAENLCKGSQARFVRLRSAEAPNLKAALKKIIREAVSQGVVGGGDLDDDVEVSVGLDVGSVLISTKGG